MSLAQRMYFLQYMFQMNAIVLVSVIKDYYFNGLHLLWDTLYNSWNALDITKIMKQARMIYKNKF